MIAALPFGPGAIAVFIAYLCGLITIAFLSRRARRENSLADFYLAGRGIGLAVLILTLYATQYSGNTLLGFSGSAYRIGFGWITCLHFMTAIVVFYQVFAPRLYRLARERSYITPSDFLLDRFNSPALAGLASVVMIVALGNFLLGQLMAMGRAVEGLTEGDAAGGGVTGAQVYIYGVILLALVIVIYETLGGLRAVAWTDALQGLLLMSGFAMLLVLVFRQFGTLGEATDILFASPEHRGKALPPKPQWQREWLSYILLVGLGGALYPQAIQRLYAARSAATLRKSLAVMAFLPLTTTLIAVITGIMALAHLPGLEGPDADRVLTVLCRQVQQESVLGYWLVVVLLAGVVAAIMSTADSALLSISSMFTRDLYAPFVAPEADEVRLTKVGKGVSWVLVAALVGLAVALREHASLIDLLDRKFDLLVQLVPAFFLGIHWRRMATGATLAGLVTGLAIAVGMAACGSGKLYGFHAGLYGLAANMAVCVLGSLLVTSPASPGGSAARPDDLRRVPHQD